MSFLSYNSRVLEVTKELVGNVHTRAQTDTQKKDYAI